MGTDESILLSWSNALQLDSLIFLVFGIALTILVAKQRKFFWPLLIIVSILGVGPRIKGYLILDEILSSFVVLGAMLSIAIQRYIPRPRRKTENRHDQVLFSLWIAYMVAESIAGVLINDDMRIFRWVYFYLLIGAISSIVYFSGSEFPFPKLKVLCLIILITNLVYYGLYLAQGIYFEQIFGVGDVGRYLSQDDFWSGSAYAVFPTLIGMPAAVFLIRVGSGKRHILAWLSISLMIFVAAFYDSRVSWIAIFGILIASVRQFSPRGIVVFISIFLILLLVTVPADKLTSEIGDVLDSANALTAPSKSDMGRNLNIWAAFDRLTDNWVTFLVGDGMYSHRFTGIRYIESKYSNYMPEDDFHALGTPDAHAAGMTIWRTTSFSGLAIDTGIIGMILFAMTFIAVVRRLLRRRTLNRDVLLAVIFLGVCWLFIISITDVVLLYLLIMPRGLVEQMNEECVVPQILKLTNQ